MRDTHLRYEFSPYISLSALTNGCRVIASQWVSMGAVLVLTITFDHSLALAGLYFALLVLYAMSGTEGVLNSGSHSQPRASDGYRLVGNEVS